MKPFYSDLTSGRRGSCPPAHRHAASFARRVGSKPGQALQDPRRPHAVSANESAPGASRRPFRKPGQALPPPPGLSQLVGAGTARPFAAMTRASLGVVDLEARPGPAAASGASRRPFRKPGQALPPPPGQSRRMTSALSRSARLGMSMLSLLVSAFLVIVGAPSSVADPSPDPDLAQSVAAHEEWSNEASEISVGHVDLGPRLIDGQWRAGLRHDAESGAVWRDPNQTVLRVSDAAIMTAPDSADYPFLADVAGKPVYVVPQTQNPGVVWLGWNTQDPAVTATIDRGLTMRVGPVSGPGRAWLFLQSGTFGKPLLLADSGAAPGDVWIDSGTHVHANWAFSAPGTYTATVTFLGTTTAGEAVSASTTLRFAVGDAASASEALAMAAPADSSAAATSGSAAQGAGSSGSASSGGASQGTGSEVSNPGASASSSEGGLPDWAFIVIIAVAILSILIIGALVVVRLRRSRAEQAAAIAEADSILAPLPNAPGEERGEAAPASSDSAPTQGEGSGERGPGLVDRGGEQ